jgi:regulator of sigma E protease
MNLLPLPALDGGRNILTIYEIITRKKVNPKFEGIINTVGFILLMALMVIITIKDIIAL